MTDRFTSLTPNFNHVLQLLYKGMGNRLEGVGAIAQLFLFPDDQDAQVSRVAVAKAGGLLSCEWVRQREHQEMLSVLYLRRHPRLRYL